MDNETQAGLMIAAAVISLALIGTYGVDVLEPAAGLWAFSLLAVLVAVGVPHTGWFDFHRQYEEEKETREKREERIEELEQVNAAYEQIIGYYSETVDSVTVWVRDLYEDGSSNSRTAII